jgi:hypothetical protein
MNWRKQGLVWGCLGLLLAVALPVRAQTGCTASPDAAVQCFVRDAVYSGLVSLPPGMTMFDYKAYGVAVSNIVQTPSTVVFLLGTMSAVADAMPATDADGVTPDQWAQDAAVDAIVDAALNDGLIALPANTTADQLKMFAHDVGSVMAQNNGVGVAPGALLRVLDSYLFNALQADGTTDWNLVQTNLSSLVDGLVGGGLVKLPGGVLPDNVKQFAFDLAVAINNYKLATGRASL